MVGNPGTGKSTLLNCLMGEVRFTSGVSIGGGLTYELQKEVVDGKGVYMDTPGLADVKLREKAAEAISEALRQDGEYRIFFVITLESGRARPADKVTMKLVMQACKEVPNFCYSIIVNKLSAPLKKKLLDPESPDSIKLRGCLNEDLPVQSNKMYYWQRVDEIDDVDLKPEKGDALPTELPDDLRTFITSAPAVRIDQSCVEDLQADEFAAMEEYFNTQMDALNADLEKAKQVNAEMQTRIQLNEQKMQDMAEHHATLLKLQKAEADNMFLQQQQEMEKIKANNRDSEAKVEKMINDSRLAAEKAEKDRLAKEAQDAADKKDQALKDLFCTLKTSMKALLLHAPSCNTSNFDGWIKDFAKNVRADIEYHHPKASLDGFEKYVNLAVRNDAYTKYQLNDVRVHKLAKHVLGMK